MGMMMLALVGFSLLLLLISIFQKDRYKELREEVDQFTLQQVQELYKLKKKIKILEEELLLGDDGFSKAADPVNKRRREIHEIIKNQVWALAQQGKPIEQIASQSSLAAEEVYAILKEYADRGKNHE